MTDMLIWQAKKIQMLAEKFLYDSQDMEYTDVESWAERQEELSIGVENLLEQRGMTSDEEAERLLAILMIYLVTIRKPKHIENVLQQAEQVMPYIQDAVLKCHLAVFCYGICYDEELGRTARCLIEEQKAIGRRDEVTMVEELMSTLAE